MALQILLYRAASDYWDAADKCLRLIHDFKLRELEQARFMLMLDDPSWQLDYVKTGNKVKVRRGGKTIFEGLIYERVLRQSIGVECEITAYTSLIRYERHVVYRFYQAGTRAGDIIRDLASLEPGIDTSNVDDGDSLLSPWEIENQPALQVMLSVARGTNYWLRMKPGGVLCFKPKVVGASRAVIGEADVLSAQYSEDRWELKNRVIYVGAGGQVLADISEGDGSLPVVVHDPFLADREEAERRSRVRLMLSREYGRELIVEMPLSAFESLNLDLGDTVAIRLPKLGIGDEDMVVLGIEYDLERLRARLRIGGMHQLFEEFLAERIGGDVAARFGQAVKIPELISAIYASVDAANLALRLQADARTLRLCNKPPLMLESSQNVVLDENGYARLIAGATQGSFESSCLPRSELFSRWLRIHYDCDAGGGEVKADLMRADGSIIASNIPPDYDISYLPSEMGWWTEQNASEWGVYGGSLEDSRNAVIGYWSIKAAKTGSAMRIYYPSTMDAGWSISKYKYMAIYLYSENDDPDLKIRLKQDDDNYLEAVINHSGGAWKKYQIIISTMSKIGNPNLDAINWLEIETDLPRIYIDSDYVFIPASRELLKLKFTLTRSSPSMASPTVKLIKFIWREG